MTTYRDTYVAVGINSKLHVDGEPLVHLSVHDSWDAAVAAAKEFAGKDAKIYTNVESEYMVLRAESLEVTVNYACMTVTDKNREWTQ